jgi:hypothetical protein
MSTVTMQELELETAELLPARETLSCWRSSYYNGGHNVTQVNNGIGDTNQNASGFGIIQVSAFNGGLF